jgi:hypothetical protein
MLLEKLVSFPYTDIVLLKVRLSRAKILPEMVDLLLFLTCQ